MNLASGNMEIKDAGFARTTITVPADIKARMDAVQSSVNWSAIAAEAFQNHLLEMESTQMRETIDGVVKRFQGIGAWLFAVMTPNDDRMDLKHFLSELVDDPARLEEESRAMGIMKSAIELYEKALSRIRAVCSPDTHGTETNDVLDTIETILKEDLRWKVVVRNRKRGYIDFVPTNWLLWLPPLGLKATPWIYVRIERSRRTPNLAYFVDVERMEEQNKKKRNEIIEKLRASCAKCRFKNVRVTEVKDDQCRVTGAENISGDDDNATAIRESVQTVLDALYPRLEKLAEVLRPLCNS